jgi:uncharacterized damage-inducible protein DinB
MDLLDNLVKYDRWATTTLFDVCRNLTDAQLDQEFDVGHRTIRATFAHAIASIEFWSGFMAGEQPVHDESPGPSFAALIERHARAQANFAALARKLEDEGRLDDIFVDHYEVRKSMDGTIVTVVMHNVEHNSEVLHILNRLGVPDLPEIDFGVWDYMLHNEV